MGRSLPLVVLLLASIVAVPASFAQSNEKTEREIIRLEHELADAFAHNDTVAIERLLPGDYVIFQPNGAPLTRDEMLASLKSGEVRTTLLDLEKLRVRLYGDTAIVTGNAHRKHNYKDEQIFDNKYHYMRVYVRRDGRWQPVVTQVGQSPPF